VPAHCRMRVSDRDLIRGGHYGQRSCEPYLQAEHIAAPTSGATWRFSLPTRSRPHMAQSCRAGMSAHLSRSGVKRTRNARAKAEIDIALSLNPNFALAHNLLGSILSYLGRPLEAIPVIEHAMRLDPAFSSQSLRGNWAEAEDSACPGDGFYSRPARCHSWASR
jgi:tetratricopeptide (TPR) repeat protein